MGLYSKLIQFTIAACLAASAQLFPTWQFAATGGGGLALPGTPSQTFGNPAAFETPRRLVTEAGVGEIGGTRLVPWLVGAFPVGRESMMGIGVVDPNTSVLRDKILRLQGASQAFRGSWLGVAGTLQKTPGHAYFDMDIGAMHRLSSHWRLGWMAENLTQTLDTSAGASSNQRQLGTGLVWFHDQEERQGLFADTHWHGLQRNGWDADVGFRSVFGKLRNLQLAGSVQIPELSQDWHPRASAGIAFQQYFFSTLVSARYAIDALSLTGEAGVNPKHQISLAVMWDAFADRTAPLPFVRSTRNAIPLHNNLESAPAYSYTDFLLRVDEESGKLRQWSLVIYATSGDLHPTQLARRFMGSGLPPASIHWTMDDIAGNPCEPGIYAFRLIAEDEAGNQAWTEWQHLEITGN